MVRRDTGPSSGVVPAGEGLDAGDLAGGQGDDGLVVQREAAVSIACRSRRSMWSRARTASVVAASASRSAWKCTTRPRPSDLACDIATSAGRSRVTEELRRSSGVAPARAATRRWRPRLTTPLPAGAVPG